MGNEQPAGRQKKILVVEDQRAIANIVKIFLTSKGFFVEIAGNAQEGFNMALEIFPDLIILDIVMPAKEGFRDGLEMLKALRDSPNGFREIPVIVFSGAEHTPRVEEAKTMAAGFVSKPFNPEGLLAEIERVISKQSGLARAV